MYRPFFRGAISFLISVMYQSTDLLTHWLLDDNTLVATVLCVNTSITNYHSTAAHSQLKSQSLIMLLG
jgi:hypothetical protein